MVALFVGVETSSRSQKSAELVREMFSAIAPRYDLLNSLLSLGFDKRWRSQAVGVALDGAPSRLLDVATGTGDFAIAVKQRDPRVDVVGVDLAEPMLRIARRKANALGVRVTWELGNGSSLPYADASFGAITVSYGLRNFEDVDKGLNEFFRLLVPGGKLVILELTTPPLGGIGSLVRSYSSKVIPLVGGMLSGSRSAYEYLPESIKEFLQPERLNHFLELAGYCNVTYWRQFPGISAVHLGIKPK